MREKGCPFIKNGCKARTNICRQTGIDHKSNCRNWLVVAQKKLIKKNLCIMALLAGYTNVACNRCGSSFGGCIKEIGIFINLQRSFNKRD